MKNGICVNSHDTKVTGVNKLNQCNECRRHWSRQRAKNHPATYKNRNWRRQGILNDDGSLFTTIDRDRAYQIQQGRCKICKTHESDLKIILFADHDHTTNKFRGLLCRGCNIKVGAVESRHFTDVVRYLGGSFAD